MSNSALDADTDTWLDDADSRERSVQSSTPTQRCHRGTLLWRPFPMTTPHHQTPSFAYTHNIQSRWIINYGEWPIRPMRWSGITGLEFFGRLSAWYCSWTCSFGNQFEDIPVCTPLRTVRYTSMLYINLICTYLKYLGPKLASEIYQDPIRLLLVLCRWFLSMEQRALKIFELNCTDHNTSY